MKHFLLIIFFTSFLPVEVFASGSWKMRAREHYEIHKIEHSSKSYEYKGFSNTINIWYERPFEYSIGLAGGPIFGSAKSQSDEGSLIFGEKIRLFNLGIEAKYFFWKQLPGLFLRGGLGWARLQTNSVFSNLDGFQLIGGLGYEFYITKSFTLAIEVAFRKSFLADQVEVSSITPSIGLHFYKLF